MSEQTNDPYVRLLAEWQARREAVEAYYRALRYLVPEHGIAAQWQRESWRELNDKLAMALTALRQTNDRMRSYEREHALASVQ
jgi:hypothetical protein